MAAAARRAMLSGLAGAGLVAALDGALQLAFPGRGLARELMTVAIAGAWIATVLVLGARLAVAALLRRKMPAPATAFWSGVALALVPPAAAILPAALRWPPGAVPLAALPPCALVALAGARATRRWAPAPAPAAAAVAMLALLLSAAPFLAPSGRDDSSAYVRRPGPASGPVPEGPDVILISADTLRADAVLGPTAAPVPNLDRLRAEGFFADFAWSPSNQTLPGHLALLTGLDAPLHGARTNSDLPRADLTLISERFQEAGYATWGIVSNGLLSRYLGFQRGYDLYDDSLVRWSMVTRAFGAAVDRNTWLGWMIPAPRLGTLLRGFLFRALRAERESVLMGEALVQRVAAGIAELQRDPRPYFYFVHLMQPHAPYPRPEPFHGRLTAGLPRPPPRYLPEDDRLIPASYLRVASGDLQRGVAEAAAACAWYRAAYLEAVSYMDQCVGRILAAARSTGRPTVVLFTGDHGEHFGEHGLLEHANSLYEPLLRIPFVVGFLNWRGEPPLRGRLAAEVTLPDAAATLLDLAGLPAAGLSGVPVHRRAQPGGAAASATTSAPRVHVALDGRGISGCFGSWKWIGRWRPDGEPELSELYDLASDPEERHNLAGRAAAPEPLLAAIRDAVARDTYRAAGPVGPEQQAALEQLGYADQRR